MRLSSAASRAPRIQPVLYWHNADRRAFFTAGLNWLTASAAGTTLLRLRGAAALSDFNDRLAQFCNKATADKEARLELGNGYWLHSRWPHQETSITNGPCAYELGVSLVYDLSRWLNGIYPTLEPFKNYTAESFALQPRGLYLSNILGVAVTVPLARADRADLLERLVAIAADADAEPYDAAGLGVKGSFAIGRCRFDISLADPLRYRVCIDTPGRNFETTMPRSSFGRLICTLAAPEKWRPDAS